MTMFTLARTAASPGAGQFLGVDWGSFVVVFLVALVATTVIVVFYSIGLRLLAVGSPADGSDERGRRDAPPLSSASVARPRPAVATVGAVLCFAVGVAAVLYGLWLIVPQFH
jgi:zona occludens toxin (predicted ATPase)